MPLNLDGIHPSFLRPFDLAPPPSTYEIIAEMIRKMPEPEWSRLLSGIEIRGLIPGAPAYEMPTSMNVANDTVTFDLVILEPPLGSLTLRGPRAIRARYRGEKHLYPLDRSSGMRYAVETPIPTQGAAVAREDFIPDTETMVMADQFRQMLLNLDKLENALAERGVSVEVERREHHSLVGGKTVSTVASTSRIYRRVEF